MELTNWKTLFKKESWGGTGGKGNFGVEIRVAVDRPLNDNDDRVAYKIADQIEDGIMRESVRIDPEQQKERDAEHKHFVEMFPENMVILAEPIPNQYCSRYCCEMSPWYKVTTPKGIVTLGWRKRVISIEWEPRVSGCIGAETLFPGENVTKDGFLIHAYGYDKAKQYLALILAPYTPEK
jgi:hypothetical protein